MRRTVPYHRTSSACSRSSRSGFTLIELLVVIGIIGILAGLLAPALSRAKERGRVIKCISNQKQIGIGTFLYVDDYEYYPPGREAGVTQWDLCVGTYAGGKGDMLSPEARSALFMCPSVRIRNQEIRLNYSANPNVFKEVTPKVGPARPDALRRPTDTILVADAIQYTEDGNSHAILWGVTGSSGEAVYWNNGLEQNSDKPIREGPDRDQVLETTDPAGANLRYRHGDRHINALFADGHAARLTKGQAKDRHFYTNY